MADKTTKAEIFFRLESPDEPVDFTSSPTWRYHWNEQSRGVRNCRKAIIRGDLLVVIRGIEHQVNGFRLGQAEFELLFDFLHGHTCFNRG